MDPDFFEDICGDYGEDDCLFGTHEKPDDADNIDIDPYENLDEDDVTSDATTMGMAFALASEMNAKKGKYDLDEDTDKENWKEAMSLQSRFQMEEKELRPFEQYIDDICKGRRSMFDVDD